MDTPTQIQELDAAVDTRSAGNRLFAGPGAARALARSLDWTSTRLGRVDGWPQSLRTAVDVCLGSRFATAVLWGPDLVVVHNDAYIPILGERFAEAMGRPAPEVLSDTWPVLRLLVAKLLAAGVNVAPLETVDIAVTFDGGGGTPRPGHVTVSLSTVHDESGRAAGVMIAAVETETALRRSEATYRAIFDSINEGLTLLDIQFDGQGRAVDFIIRDANRAQDLIDGVGALVGKRVSEIFPDSEQKWIDRYANVARSGVSIDFEDWSEANRRWYRVHASRVGGEGSTLVAIVYDDITDRKRDEATAESARVERDRSALRRQLAEAEEEERRRLARELHDEVGQHLTALGLGLQALSNVAPPNSEVDRRAAELRAVVSTMGQELHDLAVRLRPKALDDFGLEPAVAAYAEEWSRRSGIEIDLHARHETERLPDSIEGAVYRIVQEALTNVARHSGATRAGIVVERRDGHVVAIIEDDGRGFDADITTWKQLPSPNGGLGLVGIRERAALLGGTVDVESTPGAGTALFVRIPIESPRGALGPGGDRRNGDMEVRDAS